MKIRIATWNIAGARRMLSSDKFDYSPAEDARYFTEQLSALDLDVICLQESHLNESDSLAKRLGGSLGMHFVAETPGCPSHIDQNYQLTTAVISKLPFMSESYFLLPYPSFELKFVHSGKVVQAYDRYVQRVTLNRFTIANIHTEPLGAFGHSYDSGPGLQLSSSIDGLLVECLDRPLLFAADFNMSTPSIALPKCIESFGLAEALPDSPTQPNESHPDHILYSPEWTLKEQGVIPTQSDHYLCWAEFELSA